MFVCNNMSLVSYTNSNLEVTHPKGIYEFFKKLNPKNTLCQILNVIKLVVERIFNFFKSAFHSGRDFYNSIFKLKNASKLNEPEKHAPSPGTNHAQSIEQKVGAISLNPQLPVLNISTEIKPELQAPAVEIKPEPVSKAVQSQKVISAAGAFGVSPAELKEAANILSLFWEGDPLDIDQQKEDSVAKSRLNETISEGQGCKKLRNQVVVSTQNEVHSISPAALRAASNAENQGVYQTLKYKRLAHTFGIKEAYGCVLFTPQIKKDSSEGDKQNRQLQMQCFNDTFTMPMLRASLDDFLASKSECDKQRMTFSKIFANSLNNDTATDEKVEITFNLIHEQNNNLPVLIGTGYDWHSTQLIIYKDYIIYCNRGRDAIFYGWGLYKIGNKEKISKEWISKVAKRISVDHENYLSESVICENLQAKLVYVHMQKVQQTGNCTVSSLKSAISALFALDQLTDGFEKELIESDIRNNLLNLKWKKKYKEFSNFDRKELLKDFLIDLKENSQNENVQAMAYLLYKKLIMTLNIGPKIGWKLWLEMINECEKAAICNRIPPPVLDIVNELASLDNSTLDLNAKRKSLLDQLELEILSI